MKRLIALLFVCMLWSGISVAESTTNRPFTADEQAYDVYLDLSTAYNAGVEYLEEIRYLWKEATSLSNINEADQIWFNAIIAAGNELNARRMICYQNLAQIKYGYETYKGLYSNFTSYLGKTTNTLHIVGAGIELSTDAGYILSPQVLEKYLNEAKNGIRNIMSIDPNYAFTSQLQTYYKELNLLMNYIDDFDDSYFDFADKVETFAEKQVSYDVDFEFIFDPSDYVYVSDIRNAEMQSEYQRIYNQAMAAENRAEYNEAIELYWQCRNYADATERIELCRTDTQEKDYQKAIALQDTGNYKEAISIYKTLGNYKSSKSKMAQCEEALLPCEDIGSFSEGLAAIKKDGKYGYVSEYGSIIIPRSFDSASLFKSGFALVKKNGKWGYINKGGQIVIPCEYSSAYNFENGLAIVEKNGKYGFIDTTGRLIVPCEYENVWDYKDGFARVKKNGKWGFVNTDGKIVIPCEYKTAQSFNEGFAVADKDSIVANGFFDTLGNYYEIKGYEIVSYFSDGLILIRDNKTGKLGYANTSGKVVISCQFDSAANFSDGLAFVIKNNKSGFIDKTGKTIASLKYSMVGAVHNGITYARKDGKLIIIDTQGNQIIDKVFDSLGVYADGYYGVEVNGKFGMVNPNGKLEIPCEYSAVTYNEGYYTMRKNGEFFIQKAEEIIPRVTATNTSTNTVNVESSQYKTLKPGSKGQEVLDARMKLYELGYFSKKPTQTEYTNNMKDYVKKFEKDNGLKQDGVLSPEDQEVLFSL